MNDATRLPPTRLHVAFAADENYTLPVAVAGRSIAENLADDHALVAWVLDLGIGAEGRDAIRSSWPGVDARFVTMPRDWLDGLPLSEHTHARRLTAAIYGYFFLPSMTAGETRRLICVDADTLTIADLSALWRLDLDGRPFGAVQDCYVETMGRRGLLIGDGDRPVDPTVEYLNSGMLVIDIPRWQEDDLTGRVLRYARRHRNLDFPDQDCLNAVAHGQWHEIGMEWNFQVDRSFIASYSGPTPKLLHYGGLRKPWTVGSIIPHYQRMYVAYQLLTAYAEQALHRRVGDP